MDICQTQDIFTGPASASATRLWSEVISNELHTIRSTQDRQKNVPACSSFEEKESHRIQDPLGNFYHKIKLQLWCEDLY